MKLIECDLSKLKVHLMKVLFDLNKRFKEIVTSCYPRMILNRFEKERTVQLKNGNVLLDNFYLPIDQK